MLLNLYALETDVSSPTTCVGTRLEHLEIQDRPENKEESQPQQKEITEK